MKKLFFALALFLTTLTQAQNPIAKGQAQFNAGFGFSSWGIPLYLGLDYGVHKDITVGGELSFRSYRDNWQGSNYHHAIFGLLANGNYHFNHLLEIPLKWDLYAGLNVGFYLWSSNNGYDGDGASGLGLGAQLGGRYYFNEKIGINLELGGGNTVSNGKIGISVKL